MRVSMNWLRDYIDIPFGAEELAERLTMAGIAVETVESMGELYRGIIVAEVQALTAHPQADNLLVAKLGIKDGETTVVTAAKNLKVGDRIPLAQPGTTLPNGVRIEQADFRGILSQGMMCSETELGLARESDGIMVLSAETELGADIAKVLGLDDDVLVLELTANRADCYGMLGVAREVSAITSQPVRLPDVSVKEEASGVINEWAQVEIKDPDLCPRYSGRVLTDITMGPSPLWMRRRLLSAGVRPISNMVDLTNYVMLEMNQPMHAFDLQHLAGSRIVVRRAAAGELMTTLDKTERQLQPEQLLIADPEQGHCIAGVMGGSISEVSQDTKQVFLESAYFSPVSIRRTAAGLAMRTESSMRFGKGGIDPSGTTLALDRVAHLVEELGIGKIVPGIIDQYPAPVTPRTIEAKTSRINELLGTEIPSETMIGYLKKLGLDVEQKGESAIVVHIPTRRPDLENTADLAEEVARLHGFDKIPVTVPASDVVGKRTPRQQLEKNLRGLMMGFGLSEVVTYSFHGESLLDRMGLAADDPLRNTVKLWMSLSEEGSMMRTTLLGGMLQVLENNAKRRQNDGAFFEIARVYIPRKDGELPYEPLHLSGALMGLASETGWNQNKRKVDFYDGKGMLEQLMDGLRVNHLSFSLGYHPMMHPGRTAQVAVDSKILGYVGEIHPTVAKEFGFSEPVVLWEIDLENVFPAAGEREIAYRPLPKFPGISRDLATLVPESVKSGEIEHVIRRSASELLEDLRLFDMYIGDKIPAGYRSLAFSMHFRAEDRTLQEEEISRIMERIMGSLRQEVAAEIR